MQTINTIKFTVMDYGLELRRMSVSNARCHIDLPEPQVTEQGVENTAHVPLGLISVKALLVAGT